MLPFTTKPPQLSSLPINVSAAGATPLIVGEAGKSIYVYKFFFKVAAAVNLKFQHGPTDFHPVLPFAIGEGFTLDYDQEAWYACEPGEDFKIHLSGAVQVSGMLYFKKL